MVENPQIETEIKKCLSFVIPKNATVEMDYLLSLVCISGTDEISSRC